MFPLLLEFGTAGKVEAFSLRQGSGLESKAKKGEGPIKVACDKNLKDHLNSCASDDPFMFKNKSCDFVGIKHQDYYCS
jgi:hypothetical protein